MCRRKGPSRRNGYELVYSRVAVGRSVLGKKVCSSYPGLSLDAWELLMVVLTEEEPGVRIQEPAGPIGGAPDILLARFGWELLESEDKRVVLMSHIIPFRSSAPREFDCRLLPPDSWILAPFQVSRSSTPLIELTRPQFAP